MKILILKKCENIFNNLKNIEAFSAQPNLKMKMNYRGDGAWQILNCDGNQ